MVTIYNTTLSATSQRHFSDSLGGGKRTSASLIGVVGSEGMLVPSLANAITQHSDFIDLLRKATKVAAIDTISQTIKDVN